MRPPCWTFKYPPQDKVRRLNQYFLSSWRKENRQRENTLTKTRNRRHPIHSGGLHRLSDQDSEYFSLNLRIIRDCKASVVRDKQGQIQTRICSNRQPCADCGTRQSLVNQSRQYVMSHRRYITHITQRNTLHVMQPDAYQLYVKEHQKFSVDWLHLQG
jgi:hypothetical protein